MSGLRSFILFKLLITSWVVYRVWLKTKVFTFFNMFKISNAAMFTFLQWTGDTIFLVASVLLKTLFCSKSFLHFLHSVASHILVWEETLTQASTLVCVCDLYIYICVRT